MYYYSRSYETMRKFTIFDGTCIERNRELYTPRDLPHEIGEAAISRGELAGGWGGGMPVFGIVAVVDWDLPC